MTSPPSTHPATDPGDRSLRIRIVAYIVLAVFALGCAVVATPTDDPDMDHELSGIWFGTMVTASPSPGLSLPTLGAGWVYEGWAVIGGKALSTGRFATALRADSGAPYSSTGVGFAFPGEDFLRNAPPGLTFPTDISSGTVMITVEPSPDYSANPFPIRPLSLTLPASAKLGTDYTMNDQALPEGNVTR